MALVETPFSLLPASSTLHLDDIFAKSDFHGATPETQKALLSDLIAFVLANTQTIYQYVSDPNTEEIVPANQNIPNMCYPKDGVGSLFIWNTTSHVWQ